jgi:hypothetical protein
MKLIRFGKANSTQTAEGKRSYQCIIFSNIFIIEYHPSYLKKDLKFPVAVGIDGQIPDKFSYIHPQTGRLKFFAIISSLCREINENSLVMFINPNVRLESNDLKNQRNR